ncbi:hypothetical protein LG3211_4446 [Lysobacter gummosus]|nr:hypothetical protein LG3211_4446 [Lysobacter gummosus]
MSGVFGASLARPPRGRSRVVAWRSIVAWRGIEVSPTGVSLAYLRPPKPSFPRTRALLYFGGAEHPATFVQQRPRHWIPAFAGMTAGECAVPAGSSPKPLSPYENSPGEIPGAVVISTPSATHIAERIRT